MNKLDEIFNRKNTYSIKWDGIDLEYQNHDVVPMWIADMDFKAPQAVIDAIVKQSETGMYGYAMPSEMYNSYIVNWIKQENNWDIKEEDIGYASRVIDAISLAVRSLTEIGDAIIVQAPLYHFFEEIVTSSKRKLILNELENTSGYYTINFDKFEKQIVENNVKLFILCNPHNPTGRVWKKEELNQIIAICKKHNVAIISDDIHSDLIMPGQQYTPIAQLAEGQYDNIVTMKSTSKTFNLAGLQLGYYISKNKTILEAIEAEKKYCTYIDLPNNFAIPAMIAAYTEGKDWLVNVNHYIHDNFNILQELINENFPEAVLTPLEATYLSWLDVSYLGITEEELKARLEIAGIGVQTTSDFGITDGLFIRINIACPRPLLDKGLTALKVALTGK